MVIVLRMNCSISSNLFGTPVMKVNDQNIGTPILKSRT